jgi:hypothetical protein
MNPTNGFLGDATLHSHASHDGTHTQAITEDDAFDYIGLVCSECEICHTQTDSDLGPYGMLRSDDDARYVAFEKDGATYVAFLNDDDTIYSVYREAEGEYYDKDVIIPRDSLFGKELVTAEMELIDYRDEIYSLDNEAGIRQHTDAQEVMRQPQISDRVVPVWQDGDWEGLLVHDTGGPVELDIRPQETSSNPFIQMIKNAASGQNYNEMPGIQEELDKIRDPDLRQAVAEIAYNIGYASDQDQKIIIPNREDEIRQQVQELESQE